MVVSHSSLQFGSSSTVVLPQYKPLRLAVAALHRYTVAQKESFSIREAIETQTQEFRRLIHVKDQALRTSRTIEENLVERMNALEDEYKE